MARSIIICKGCGKEKLLAAKGLCKQCYMRQWREAHQEERREYQRQWAKDNPDKEREHDHRYYVTHREESAANNRKWIKANPEQFRVIQRRSRKAHPGKKRECVRRRRARLANATIGPVDEAAIYERDGYMCLYCGATEDLTIDHIVPLSNDGPHCEDNLLVACGHCNSSKNARPLAAWLQTQPYSIAWLF